MRPPPETALENPRTPCHPPFAFAAWTFFTLSLFLPAFDNFVGWQCASVSFSACLGADLRIPSLHLRLLTLANVFMLMSPIFVFRRKSGERTMRLLRIASLASVFLTTTYMLWFADGEFQNLRLGYFLWIFSFALLGLSFFRSPVTPRTKP